MKDIFVLGKYKRFNWLLCFFIITSLFAGVSFSATEDISQSLKSTKAIELTGRWNQGPVFASAVSGSYMYFGSSGTVRVVKVDKDASGNATAWQEVASIETDGVVRDMLVAGHYLYIADGSGWMRVINIKQPYKPKLIGALKLQSEIKAIAYDKDRVYIAAGWKGVHIIDVSVPEKPELLNSYESKGYSLDLVVMDSIAFVAAGHDAGLQISDLSDPQKPQWLGEHDISGSASGIDSDGRFVYVVNMDDEKPNLSIFDAEDRENPVQVAAEPLIYGAERVRLQGSLAYVAGVANDAGLIVIDVSSPHSPNKLGSWWDPTCSESVTVDNQIAYLAHGDQGLEILDVRNPSEPTVIEHFAAAGRVRGVDTQGKLAFVANGYRGLKIVDVTQPKQPQDIAEIKTYRALDVDVAGPFAHIADDWAGYKLVDISDANNPVELASLDTPGYAEAVHVVGHYAYIADGEGGLRILNVLKPQEVKEVGSVALGGYAYEVFVQGNTAFVAAGKAGLVSIDVSNPSNPYILDDYKFTDRKFEARGVDIKGSYAYLAAGYMGMAVIDISSPSSMSTLGIYETSRRANNVSIFGHKAYLIDSDSVRVLDISKPQRPMSLAQHDLPASAARIHASERGVYVAGMESGLLIFDK